MYVNCKMFCQLITIKNKFSLLCGRILGAVEIRACYSIDLTSVKCDVSAELILESFRIDNGRTLGR